MSEISLVKKIVYYSVGFLVAAGLGALIQPSITTFLYEKRTDPTSILFYAYAVLALLHFFGMGFTVLGVAFNVGFALREGSARTGACAQNDVSENAGEYAAQSVLGGIVYAAHLIYAYVIPVYDDLKQKRKACDTKTLPCAPSLNCAYVRVS